MTVTELKNICELLEKKYGPDTKIKILFSKKDGGSYLGQVNSHTITYDKALVLSNREFFK